MKRIPIKLTEKDWLRICALLMVQACSLEDGDIEEGLKNEGIAFSSKIMAQLGEAED
jgi:hypothetical protein